MFENEEQFCRFLFCNPWERLVRTLLVESENLIEMIRRMTKPAKWYVRPAKSQISLGIRPVWSESSLSAWVFSYPLNAQRRLRSDWTDRWAHSHFVGFIMHRLKSLLLWPRARSCINHMCLMYYTWGLGKQCRTISDAVSNQGLHRLLLGFLMK